jgi:hypothetical protein
VISVWLLFELLQAQFGMNPQHAQWLIIGFMAGFFLVCFLVVAMTRIFF